MTPSFKDWVSFLCYKKGVNGEREDIFPAHLSFRLWLIYFKGEMIMFKDNERLEMLEKIDKKLSQIIAILNRNRITKKGDKKDV